jgi:hypothetical protein
MVSYRKEARRASGRCRTGFRAVRRETQEGQQHELRRRAQSPDHKHHRVEWLEGLLSAEPGDPFD